MGPRYIEMPSTCPKSNSLKVNVIAYFEVKVQLLNHYIPGIP